MIFKYKKRPVVIEAIQLRWDTWSEICDFVTKPWFKEGCFVDENGKETKDNNGGLIGLKIYTLEGDLLAVENDYIIKGIKGEFYPCKPDIFEATYEKVEG
jgi:hypothetical protein